MIIYIVEAHAGQWSDKYQWNIRAFKKKENAEAFMKNIKRFIPLSIFTKSLQRACKYELTKRGILCGWKDIYEDIPFLTIQETILDD